MKKLFLILGDCLQCNPTEISFESSSKTILSWDSLAKINIAVSLESEYDVCFASDELERLNSVNEIFSLLNSKGVKLDEI